MKYAFLTMLIPHQLKDETRERSKNNMQDAASALQWHIYEGLCANIEESIKLFNILPVGSFPQYYSRPFIKKSTFDDEFNKEHVNIDFCNVKLVRKWHQPKKIFKQLKAWCTENSGDKTLFVYTISAPFMSAVAKLKKHYPELRVCAIIADLPNMSSLSSNKGFFEKLLEEKLASDSYYCIDCVDAFVLLTRQMADYMKISRPYVVMEGISTPSKELERRQNNETKTILYTGTLHKKFGILNLVDAFKKIEAKNYRLVICGVGDSESEIVAAAKQDERIVFRGQLTRDEVLMLQQEATVLVNPRQNNEEFTKYSFPSKNLEYLSSGVPLIAYKLDGIPDEYDDYINYVPDNSIIALRDKLIEVCEDVGGFAAERASKAARFVRDEKNARKQTLKIKQLLDAHRLSK